MPALRALTAQLVAAIFTLLLIQLGVLSGLPLLALAAIQGCLAAALAAAMRMANWWLPIHLVFLPAAILAAGLALPAWIWALAFGVFALIYWTTFRTQVPLFLSNRRTVETLAEALPAGPLKVLDLGSGTGSFVRHFARLRPESEISGIESAPGPAALGRWLARGLRNTRFSRGDFFAADWSGFDVVYAFLSPVPMRDVWQKAVQEMRPGAVLISNSFPVPEREPDGVLEIGDRRKTSLYCYTIRADKPLGTPRRHRIWPWSQVGAQDRLP